jgi:hypothetical protein
LSGKSSSDHTFTKVSVFSADEDDIQLAADLASLKASYLYAEDIQLASVRLFYALLATRGYQNKHLRERYRDLEEKVGLADVIDLSQIGLTAIGDFPLDERAVRVLDVLAEGYRRRAFTILNYQDAIKAMPNLLRGDWDRLGIPV